VRVGNAPLPEAFSWPGDALLFDTEAAGAAGGTGTAFDWTLLADAPRSRPVVLAGGLTPANVGEAIRAARPDVVDVASGVESAPGVKDRARMERFFAAVKEADASEK